MRTQLFAEKKRIKENIKNDLFLQKQLEAIKADADILMKEETVSLSYDAFKTFYITGSRKEYERGYFCHRRRINHFAVLSAVYEDNSEYIRFLQDAVWAVLDEFAWSLPAHIPQGTEITECETWIDLFAAETAFTLAEIASMLSGRLDDVIIERIAREVRRRVIIPYLSGRKNSWDCLENNWSAVCAGSVGAAFLYLADDSEIKAAIPRLKNTLECYLKGFGNDGVCVEGLNYWIYGFGYFTYFAQLLCEYTDGGDNLFNNDKVKNIALFPQKIYFKNNNTVSFSDCGNKFIHRSGLTHFLKKRYDDIAVPNDDSALEFDGDSCYRFAHLIRDFAWRDSQIQMSGEEKECFEYFENAAWYIKKTRLYEFAAKAGVNNESHNHNDIASFLLNVSGCPVVTDPGRGEYTADYFSDKRYEYFAPSALAHSVPIINGKVQQAGGMYRGSIVKAENNNLVINFENAYDDKNLKKLSRSFMFYEDKIVMSDKISFTGKTLGVTEHFVLDNRPVQSDRGLIMGNIQMCYDEGMFDCKISEKTFAADYDKYKTVYIADLECINPEKEMEIVFEINVAKASKEDKSYE